MSFATMLAQKKLEEYLLPKVQPGRESEARAILAKGVSLQEKGALDESAILTLAPKLADTLKPEARRQVAALVHGLAGAIPEE